MDRADGVVHGPGPWTPVHILYTSGPLISGIRFKQQIDLFAVKSAILKVGQTPAKHAGYCHMFPSNFRACETYCSGFVAFSTSHSN